MGVEGKSVFGLQIIEKDFSELQQVASVAVPTHSLVLTLLGKISRVPADSEIHRTHWYPCEREVGGLQAAEVARRVSGSRGAVSRGGLCLTISTEFQEIILGSMGRLVVVPTHQWSIL